jgi:hypothetical protein
MRWRASSCAIEIASRSTTSRSSSEVATSARRSPRDARRARCGAPHAARVGGDGTGPSVPVVIVRVLSGLRPGHRSADLPRRLEHGPQVADQALTGTGVDGEHRVDGLGGGTAGSLGRLGVDDADLARCGDALLRRLPDADVDAAAGGGRPTMSANPTTSVAAMPTRCSAEPHVAEDRASGPASRARRRSPSVPPGERPATSRGRAPVSPMHAAVQPSPRTTA